MTPQFTVIRLPTTRVASGENYTPGFMYYKGLQYCFTCEDEDRYLETNPSAKVWGKTAIPRGTYRLTIGKHSIGNSPLKDYVEINDIPNYRGVLFHGGNKAEQSHGCVLLGKVRTSTGVAQCKDTVDAHLTLVQSLMNAGEEVWLEVK